MKIKPIESESKETYNNTRYNENAIGIINGIKVGNTNNAKSDYSAVVLTCIMHELGYLKHALIKESFEEVKDYIERIEGESL